MFLAGTQVRLLHAVGDYPAGTLATGVETRLDKLREIEVEFQLVLISAAGLPLLKPIHRSAADFGR